MPLVDGATAAGFSIVRLLGRGQIGELYLAEHPRLPRHDALKIVSADLSADPEYRYRFKQATGRAAVLWHPNIVSLHDRGEFEDRLWLSMDYVDGIDTAQLLTDTYPEGLPPDLVVEIVFAIAEALDYAHELGLVHGYVNPSNILISNLESRRRRILLAGFGLPRRPDETNSLTRANLGIGTVSYAAPEQLMDDSIDGRTDQYALAGTAFHLLTGSPPFAHMNPAVLISKHLNEAPPRPGDVRPGIDLLRHAICPSTQEKPHREIPPLSRLRQSTRVERGPRAVQPERWSRRAARRARDQRCRADRTARAAPATAVPLHRPRPNTLRRLPRSTMPSIRQRSCRRLTLVHAVDTNGCPGRDRSPPSRRSARCPAGD